MTQPIDVAYVELRSSGNLERDVSRDVDRAMDRAEKRVDAATKDMADSFGKLGGVITEDIKKSADDLDGSQGRFRAAGEKLGASVSDGMRRGASRGPGLDLSLSKAIPNLGSFTKVLGGVSAASAGAVAAVNTVSVAIAALVPIAAAGAAALPGLAASYFAATTLVKVGTAGVGDALKAATEDEEKFREALEELAPEAQKFAVAFKGVVEGPFARFRQFVQDRLFDDLGAGLTRAGGSLDALRPVAGLAADAMNTLASRVLDFAAGRTAVLAAAGALGTVRSVVDQIADGITPVLEGLASLSLQFSAMSAAGEGGITNLLVRFGNFLKGIDLSGLFDAAAPILQSLAGIGRDLGTIFSGVFRALATDGTTALGVLGTLISSVADFVASAEGVAALNALGTAVKQLAGLFSGALSQILPLVGQVAAAVAPAIGPVIESVGGLLRALGPALQGVLAAVVPLLAPIGQLLTSVLAPLGPLIAQIAGQLSSGVLVPFVEFFTRALAELTPVIGEVVVALGALVGPTLGALLPLIPSLVDSLLPLLPAIADLVPPLAELAIALAPLLVLAAQLATALLQVQMPLIRLAAVLVGFLASKAVVPLIEGIAQALTFILSPLSKLTPLFAQLGDTLSGITWASIGNAIAGAFTTALEAVGAFFAAIGGFFASLPGLALRGLAALPGLMADGFAAAFDAALRAIGIGIGLIIFAITQLPGLIIGGIIRLATELPQLMANIWGFAVQRTQQGINAIVTFALTLPGRVVGAIASLRERVGQIFIATWRAARERTVAGVNAVIGFVANAPSRLFALAGRFASAGRALISAFARGFKSTGNFIGDVAGSIVGAIKGFINRVIGRINSGIADIDKVLPGSLPRIPMLATGGMTLGPTVAALSENGKREVVLPIENQRVMGAIVDALGGAGRSGPAIVFAERSVVVEFSGALPTVDQAHRAGVAVGDGIASALERRRVVVQMGLA